jgi:4-aminobutyrate aminotransferase
MNKAEILFKRDTTVLSDVMKLRFYPLAVETAEGSILKGFDGKQYLDFNAGWGVANLGYKHPRILDAVSRQMNKLPFLSTISMINEESVVLAEQLTNLTPGNFEKKVWYGHSGSDANEFIAKILPIATGKPRILSFVGSYHGQTMGAYAISGHPAQSKFITGGNVTKVPYPYCYRCAFDKEEATCDQFCIKYIEDYILKFVSVPDQIGAIVVEAIQCDGGDVVPPDGFLKGLEMICRKYGICLVLDEVKIGFGRTGMFFGFEHWNIIPDLVVMGKPLGAGQPLSAVVGRREIMDACVSCHLFTTAGNPLACAVAQESIEIISEELLVKKAKENGMYLKNALTELAKKHDVIGDVRGKGLLVGVELVKDHWSKTPADEMAALVAYRSYELGLLYYYAGVFNNVLELTPPLIITKDQVKTAVEIIDQSIQDVLDGKVPREKIAAFAGWG